MKNLQKFSSKIRRLVSGRVILHTDEYTIYEGIAEKIPEVKEHHTINHANREWARGDVHVNGCENRNGFIRGYLWKHRGISKDHLQGYLDFIALVMNEKGRWFELIISDNSRT